MISESTKKERQKKENGETNKKFGRYLSNLFKQYLPVPISDE